MSAKSIKLELKINYSWIFAMMVLLHLIVLFIQAPLELFQSQKAQISRAPLKIQSLRTVGQKDKKSLNSAYLSHNQQKLKDISAEMFKATQMPLKPQAAPSKKSLSFQDLKPISDQVPVRPGKRPETQVAKKSIQAINLKGQQIQKFMNDAVALSGDRRSPPGLSNSDIMVNLEVPEGVKPDELNEFELMFYSFQRRTAINYINSFYKNLDKFQRENPHKQFPMTDTRQIMTGRLTYDEKGNLKQIKMIRWSNVDRLQDFFVDVLKDMDTLHNPPKSLWEKQGEFAIFFSLVING
jgi:hypothetical protein